MALAQVEQAGVELLVQSADLAAGLRKHVGDRPTVGRDQPGKFRPQSWEGPHPSATDAANSSVTRSSPYRR
ncbi:hypothetical protein KCH_71530 [Kitasatospora cheerisanensis KCTC 2395]|uniref:Uncharacterized protein n=1 Tax=Kitasatospora cheerisanensis KCTC 2395 TaxID=1348663 RepID=A0A066YM94_9ACTN|nr:hypothetical protein KCH_71530 [Kitasatospora cheerisanensis KCTC 2395]